MESRRRAYEFDDGQNALIGALASRMRWVAIFMMVFALIAIVGGFSKLHEGGASWFGEGILVLIVAVWTLRAAGSFREIVRTKGSDVAYLMTALGELKKLYTLQFWVILIVLATTVSFLLLMAVQALTAVS